MKEKKSIQDRIEDLIIALHSNKLAFAKKVGTSDGVIGNIVGGRRSEPSYDLLMKIIASVDNLNIEWLMTGKGEMFVGEQKGGALQGAINEIVATLAAKVERQGSEISKLQGKCEVIEKIIISKPSLKVKP